MKIAFSNDSYLKYRPILLMETEMPEDDTWTEYDEYDCDFDYAYYRLWLFDSGAVNRNGLRWLYDEE
jgi:hypothetical protein